MLALLSRSRLLAAASSRLLLFDAPPPPRLKLPEFAPLMPPSKRKAAAARGTSTAAKKEAASEASISTSAPPNPPLSPPLKKKKPYTLPTSPNAGSASLLSKAERISAQLAALYPDPPCPLDHKSRTQLLCAVMLSAQTTDVKVNEATKTLFAAAPTAADLAALGAKGIEAHIRSLGLAPTKAKNVAATAALLVERYGADADLPVAVSREELESLPGVGRKTASVVLAMSGREPALPVDTHIHRLAQRWGFSKSGASVLQVEADLCAAFGANDGVAGQWDKLHLRLIYFGREHCPAQRHDRARCPICSWAAV